MRFHFSGNRICRTITHFSGKRCRLRLSTQHSPEVYSQESRILRSFWELHRPIKTTTLIRRFKRLHPNFPPTTNLYYIFTMSKVNCPHCASLAVKVGLIDGYKFYCSSCGWNHEIVRGELFLTIKVSFALVALAVILSLVVRLKNPSEGWASAGILVAFSGLPVYFALSAFHQMRKLGNLSFQSVTDQSRAFTISEMESSSDVPSKTIMFTEKEFPELVALPRPRKLKFTWKGRFYFVFALIVVGLYTVYGLPATWSEFNNPHSSHGRNWLLLAPLLVIYGNAFAFFRNRFRERQLLANGEVASGYVTAQNNGRYTQSIQYCFRLAGGKLATGRCNDASRSLYEGMTVPVFYDAENPTRSMPLDCSLTRIA